jgi:hypothetical protein
MLPKGMAFKISNKKDQNFWSFLLDILLIQRIYFFNGAIVTNPASVIEINF